MTMITKQNKKLDIRSWNLFSSFDEEIKQNVISHKIEDKTPSHYYWGTLVRKYDI